MNLENKDLRNIEANNPQQQPEASSGSPAAVEASLPPGSGKASPGRSS